MERVFPASSSTCGRGNSTSTYILDATAEISMTFGNWSRINITQTLSIKFIRHCKQRIWEAIRRWSFSHHNVTLMQTATYLVKWKLLSEPIFPFWEIGHGNGTSVKFFTHTTWFHMILNILQSKRLLRVWWIEHFFHFLNENAFFN